MASKDVFALAKEEHARIIRDYRLEKEPALKYMMLAKLMEEMGELSEAVLHADSLQRSGKRAKKADIEGEIADVLLGTLIFSHEMGIDAEKAFLQKMARIKRRKY